MSTVNCRDCGKYISRNAAICPHCGCPSPASGTSAGTPGVPGASPTPTPGPAPVDKTKTIAQMGFSPVQLAFATDTVRGLSIQDLEDLANSFFNQVVNNPIIATLRAVDLRGIEDLFADQRATVLQRVAGFSGPGGPVTGPGGPPSAPGGTSISCCSCTPCCCCSAAVETDPFRDW